MSVLSYAFEHMRNIHILCAVTMIPLLAANVVFAEAVPSSKCVTSSTQATYASVTARMQSDIAPYASAAAASDAIKTYRTEMTTAWDAMNEPYCGYGAYGTASAIKSYAKTVDRARTAFITAIASLSLKKAALVTTKPVTTIIATPVVTAPMPASGSISSGLQEGMRSAGVMALQKKLTAYYKIVQDASSVTGYFGPKTNALVIRFQIEKKILTSAASYGAGYVGPKTAAALSAI